MKTVAFFANLSLVYLLSCVLYLIIVRASRMGTPFNDSLTDAQRRLKRQSARMRGRAYALALTAALVFVFGVCGF